MFYKTLGFLVWKSFKIALGVKLHGFRPSKKIVAGTAAALAGGVALAVASRSPSDDDG